MCLINLNAEIVACMLSFRKSRHKPNLESTSKYGFSPDLGRENGVILSMRMQVGLFFRSPGLSPYMGREERRVQGLDYLVTSLRSKRSRTRAARMSFSHSSRAKMRRMQKSPPFCSRLIFRAARMRKNSFVRPEFRSRGTETLATQATLLLTISIYPTFAMMRSEGRRFRY